MIGWLVLAAACAAAWLAVAIALERTRRAVASLADEPAELAAWPRLSVVVPARNEAAGVEAALRSLLAQDYPGLEVIAVDDRSSDATGAILDALAAQDPRLGVVHVRELPVGWLGKNHASHLGAQAARGAWLLFTDADVLFAPDALRRAMAAALRRGVAHLVASPHMVAPGFGERAFVSTFALFACLKFRMWQLSRPATQGFVGVGAFNLVRRDAYDAVGGHRGLAFEIVDDVKLGMLLRRSGFAQAALDSAGMVRVRWQQGLLASLRGLLKNSFAAVEYRWGMVAAGVVLMLLLALAPFALLWAPDAGLRSLGLLLVLASMVGHGAICRRAAAGHGCEGVLLAPCILALVGVLLWSAVAATARGAVVWRGTRYPLAQLEQRCVRERDWPARRAPGWSIGPPPVA